MKSICLAEEFERLHVQMVRTSMILLEKHELKCVVRRILAISIPVFVTCGFLGLECTV